MCVGNISQPLTQRKNDNQFRFGKSFLGEQKMVIEWKGMKYNINLIPSVKFFFPAAFVMFWRDAS